MPHPVRQRILITGASSGLGEGTARLGGLDRFVVNAGIGRGASIGTGKA